MVTSASATSSKRAPERFTSANCAPPRFTSRNPVSPRLVLINCAPCMSASSVFSFITREMLRLPFGQALDFREFFRGHGLYGESRVLQQNHLLELRAALDRIERDRLRQFLDRNEVHAGPVAFLGRGVRVGLGGHLREAHDFLSDDTVIVEDLVPL